MSDYQAVETALTSGIAPSLLCETCPWDRYCITPPSMTKADYDAKMEEAKAEDDRKMQEEKAAGKAGGLPMGSLLTAMALGGKHRAADVCPVFALRLRSSEGRSLVDGMKTSMKSWDDER